jgi:hypothetical protein
MFDLLTEPLTIETAVGAAWWLADALLSSLFVGAPAERCPGVDHPG